MFLRKHILKRRRQLYTRTARMAQFYSHIYNVLLLFTRTINVKPIPTIKYKLFFSISIPIDFVQLSSSVSRTERDGQRLLMYFYETFFAFKHHSVVQDLFSHLTKFRISYKIRSITRYPFSKLFIRSSCK